MPNKLIKNNALYLYGPVGGSFWSDEGFTATDVLDALGELPGDEIDVHINSGGGLAFDGIAIYNALKASDKLIRTHVDGIAASAASIIAMAGDEVVMHDGALMMVHDASGFTMGNAVDHEKTVAVLHKLDGQLANVYSRRTGKKAEAMRAMMDAETWMDCDEAVAQGFATAKVAEASAAVSGFAYHSYKNAPMHLKGIGWQAGDQRSAVFTPNPEAVARFTAAIAAVVPEPPIVKPQEKVVMNLETLRAEHPALYAEVMALGVAAERARVSGIMELSAPGAEAVLSAAIANGQTRGDAAEALLRAERSTRVAALATAAADEAALAGLRAQPPAPPAAKPGDGLEGEAKYKAEWQAMSEDDRSGFFDRFGTYKTHRTMEEAKRH